MESMVKIPKAWVMEFDDIGWDNGRDLRLKKKASRSGLPRYHTIEDYQLMAKIGEESGMTLNGALCLADWDKDNCLRGFVGATHNPYEWDRASEMDMEKFNAIFEFLQSTEYIDYSIHGLLHGVYDENGILKHEREYFDLKEEENGEKKLRLRSVEDFNRRLDHYFKIYNSWGFNKELKVFISPCGLAMASEEELNKIAGELYKRGVRYWTNGGFCFPENLKVINGVVCAKKGIPMRNGDKPEVPWNAYDVDPTTFLDYTESPSCVFGIHWTNLLRYNPQRNFEQIKPWADYIKRQGEIFGLVNAKNIVEAINQHLYHEFATMSVSGNVITIDVSKVMADKVDCHKDEFFLSFKKGAAPKNIEGGEITLYQSRKDFDTYKIAHKANVVKIEM